jgi:glycosyltransferase involved in cell wall biosynthesis
MSRNRPARRILFVDHTPFAGGAQLVLADHLRTLDRERFEAHVACTPTVPLLLERFRDAGAELHLTPLPRLRDRDPLVLARVLGAVRRLRGLVVRGGFDLVVSNTSRAAYLSSLALAGTGVPLMWWVRDFDYGQRWFRLLRRAPARILCVSEAIRRYYGGEGDPAYEVVVVGNDIYERFGRHAPEAVRAARRDWGVGEDEVLVGYMGRLVEGKGPQDLVEAVRRIHAEHPGSKLLLVGTGANQEGDVEAALKRDVERAGLGGVVRFAGYQTDEALFYQMFDLFVLSTRMAEAMPTSVVQAMMAGKPVVATATGGTPELVRDGETGVLVPPADPGALARAIGGLLSDPARAAALGAAGRRHVMEHHREEVTTARVEALYEALVPDAPSRGSGPAPRCARRAVTDAATRSPSE